MEKDVSQSKFKPDDILFVLFRRKWIILALCVAGLAGAAVAYKTSGRLYSSQAKVLVRYVMDSGAVLPPGSEDRIRQTDSRGDNIINTEKEILTSFDLAKQVAAGVGSERILGGAQPEGDANAAAAVLIMKGLSVDVAPRGSIINVSFAHFDPTVCQAVLTELLEAYKKKHAELHLSGANYDLLAKQTDELKLRLGQTDKELHEIRSQVHGVSLEQAKASLADELQSIRAAILETEIDLAAASPGAPAASLPASGSTQLVASASSSTNSQPEAVQNSPSGRIAYAALIQRAQTLEAKKQDYLSRFTEDNPLVKSVRSQIAEVNRDLEELTAANPYLALTSRVASVSGAGAGAELLPAVDPAVALHSKLNVLTNQLQVALTEAARLNDLENSLNEVLRRKQIQEENYKHLATSLERERFDTALESTKLSNINIAEDPTPPLKNSKAAKKLALAILGGVAGGGIALVFLFELFLDPRLKRASQIEHSASLPLYISIPSLQHNGAAGRLASANVRALAEGDSADNDKQGDAPQGPLVGELRSYYEALRDRIIVYFERVNLRRKPKLIGLTACHRGAGVSTLAEGLASTLSETGGGKVLLVDLNDGQEAVHTYHMGRPVGALPQVLEQAGSEALEKSEPSSTLYLASFGRTNGHSHPTRSREFDLLMPKLKASDFDYVVFDMPPLNPTSITFRVSGFMDKILLVGEAERTHTSLLKQSVTLLQETNSRVSLVMNKTREYMPRWLQPPK